MAMTVEIKNNELCIEIDLEKPTPSASGKTLVVASTRGNEGFEPWVPFRTPDFESGTIDHSDTSPWPFVDHRFHNANTWKMGMTTVSERGTDPQN